MRIVIEQVDCQTCGGSGEVTNPDDPDAPVVRNGLTRCPICDGSGKQWPEDVQRIWWCMEHDSGIPPYDEDDPEQVKVCWAAHHEREYQCRMETGLFVSLAALAEEVRK